MKKLEEKKHQDFYRKAMTSATLFISIFEKMGLWGAALSIGGTPHNFKFCGEVDLGQELLYE